MHLVAIGISKYIITFTDVVGLLKIIIISKWITVSNGWIIINPSNVRTRVRHRILMLSSTYPSSNSWPDAITFEKFYWWFRKPETPPDRATNAILITFVLLNKYNFFNNKLKKKIILFVIYYPVNSTHALLYSVYHYVVII